MNGHDSAMVPKGMTGTDIAMAASKYHQSKQDKAIEIPRFANDPAMIERLTSLERAIKSTRQLDGEMIVDTIHGVVNYRIRENNKLQQKQKKISRFD